MMCVVCTFAVRNDKKKVIVKLLCWLVGRVDIMYRNVFEHKIVYEFSAWIIQYIGFIMVFALKR